MSLVLRALILYQIFAFFLKGTFVRARVINDPSPGLDTARDVHAV